MSKRQTHQSTFGIAKIQDSHSRGICDCGNSSTIQIARKDEITHYCKNCARNTWLEVVEE